MFDMTAEFEEAYDSGIKSMVEVISLNLNHKGTLETRITLGMIGGFMDRYMSRNKLQEAESCMHAILTHSRFDAFEHSHVFHALAGKSLALAKLYAEDGDDWAAISNAEITYKYARAEKKNAYQYIKEKRDENLEKEDFETADYAGYRLFITSPDHSNEKKEALAYILMRSKDDITKQAVPEQFKRPAKSFADLQENKPG